MAKPRYWMTPTAKAHYQKIVRNTYSRWGMNQAETYRAALAKGFQHIAKNHKSFSSSRAEGFDENTEFYSYLIEHHYVAYRDYGNDVIIAGLFHENMDLPTRLKELQAMSRLEIVSIKATIQ